MPNEKAVKGMADKLSKAETRIEQVEEELRKIKSEGVATAEKKRFTKFDREAIRQERAEIFSEIDEILKSTAAANDLGKVAYDSVRFGKAVGKLASNYLKEGVASLDEVASKVISDLESKGIFGTTKQNVIDAMTEKSGQSRTRSELEQQIAKLEAEARANSTRNRQKLLGKEKARIEAKDASAQKKRAEREFELKGQIADLRKQLKDQRYRVKPKREIELDAELETLRAERDFHQSRIQQALRVNLKSASKRFLLAASQNVRGTILGSDAGILTRQGLFSLARPGAYLKGLQGAVKAFSSDVNLVKLENHLFNHKVNGKTAGPIYKKIGLNLSSHLGDGEELVVAGILKKIPGVKILAGSLERAQAGFINSVRSATIDAAIKRGYSEIELARRARFVNSVTGRSNLKEVSDSLKIIMTSPRYEASRWETIASVVENPAILARDLVKGEGVNRGALANIQDLTVTAAEIYGLFKLAEASGYEVDFNAESGDFLKMRKGDEVWDASAGIAPRVRDIMRIIVWAGNPDQYKNAARVVRDIGVRTISPGIRTPAEIGSQNYQRSFGKEEEKIVSLFTGYKLEPHEKGWVTLFPLIAQSAWTYFEKGDIQGGASAVGREFVGQSVRNYPKPNK